MATQGIGVHGVLPLPDGFEYYDCEAEDFVSQDGTVSVTALQAGVRYVVRFAGSYWAAKTFTRQGIRQGALPRSRAAKERWVDELFEWFGQPAEGFSGALGLEAGDIWILDAHDGFPGPVQIRREDYPRLQQAMLGVGLRVDFTNANLQNANLTHAKVYGSNFNNANLTGADLSGADAHAATFQGAIVTSANFSGADLHGADFTGAIGVNTDNFPGANTSGCTGCPS